MLWERLLRRVTYRWRISGIVLVLLAANVGWAARHHPALTVPLELVATLPLLLLRRRPLTVLGIVLVTEVIGDLAFHWSNPFPVWISLFTVARYKPRRTSLLAALATLAAVFVSHEVVHPWADLAKVLTVLASWVLGDTLRSRRRWLDEEQEQSMKRVALDEQARIARELHDVIAHNVSVMVVQAAAANDVFDAHPEKAREALRSIEDTGRSALTELRRLLGVVQTPEADAYAPQPGLGGLDQLVARVRAAGLPVAVHVDGALGDLPTGLDLSAYRIVQEALTNTLKHAGASRAEVGIRRTPTSLELEIVDDGVGNGSSEDPGRGLIGMQERAGLVGGEVSAGPRAGGGFQVRARLPL
jgi:signal transduction histidine kinase